MSESSARDEFLEIFDLNDFASTPYPLVALHLTRRRLLRTNIPRIWDEYAGEALQVGNPGKVKSKHLIVPPNMAAVVLTADGKQKVLPPGLYRISHMLNYQKPISVQFVNTQTRSFEFEALKVHTREHLTLDLDLVVVVQVANPDTGTATGAELVIKLDNPKGLLKDALVQELVVAMGRRAHEVCVENLIDILRVEVVPGLNRFSRTYGLRVETVMVGHVHPDDLETSAAALRRKRELETAFKLHEGRARMLEAQANEDAFAVEQPALRRRIMGDFGTQARERNHAARMEAIETVGTIAKAFLDGMRAYPGRIYTEKDMAPLMKALDLFGKLTDPVNAPPIPQQVRSKYAVDEKQPEPPDLSGVDLAFGRSWHRGDGDQPFPPDAAHK